MRRFIQPDILLYLFLMILGIGGIFVAVAWPQTEGMYSFIVLSALGGLGVTIYIFYAKHFKQSLACPTGSDCNVVVNSKYSKFLGISLEYLGSLYYLAIAISYLVLIFSSSARGAVFLPIVLMLTTGAFVFSLYLLFVQAFILRQWCIWCLLSATLSIVIFITSLTSISFAKAFLVEASTALELIRTLGFVIGMGSATSAVFLFLRFLRNDLDIDDTEATMLKQFSELIWLGLALIFVATYSAYVANPIALANSGMFLAELLALVVVFFTGAALSLLFAPVVSALPFYEHKRGVEGEHALLGSLRRWGLILGGVSLASWYFAFVVHYLPDYSTNTFISVYIAIIFLAAVSGYAFNRRVS